MPHALCQWAAKAWVMSCKFSFLINFAECIANTVLMMGLVFDRMFQLKIVHSANPGTEKVNYFPYSVVQQD